MKIYMFHYVKDKSNYYHFNAKLFEDKIKELLKKYKIISLKDMKSNNDLNNSIMLTFDDGTIDHYEIVYPILKKLNVSGLFFIPSCIKSKKMLDIQIIHKLLEVENSEILLKKICRKLDGFGIDINNYKVDKSLDSNSMALVKQLLQFKLDKDIREKILNDLANSYHINLNVEDSYISIKHLKEMKDNNMFFGIHTKTHPRLGLLDKDEQREEISSNLNFLKSIGIVDEDLISIAFPYGSYNDETIELMKELNIKYGFKVNEDKDNYNLISRIDCNCLKEEIL